MEHTATDFTSVIATLATIRDHIDAINSLVPNLSQRGVNVSLHVKGIPAIPYQLLTADFSVKL